MSFKVSLTGGNGKKVIFESSPVVTESRQSSWENYSITHLPVNLLAHRATSGRSITITAKLISRTLVEAAKNRLTLSILRKWSLPDFNVTGAPPDILRLNGYEANLKDIQVVMVNYDWTYPDEVDWITTGTEPFPVIINVTVQLQETYSPAQLKTFNRENVDFAGGTGAASGGGLGDMFGSIIGSAIGGRLGGDGLSGAIGSMVGGALGKSLLGGMGQGTSFGIPVATLLGGGNLQGAMNGALTGIVSSVTSNSSKIAESLGSSNMSASDATLISSPISPRESLDNEKVINTWGTPGTSTYSTGSSSTPPAPTPKTQTNDLINSFNKGT